MRNANEGCAKADWLFVQPRHMVPHPQKDYTMTQLMVRLQNTIANREERGAAMAEYGLLLALVALAAIVVLAAFGDSLVDVFTAADTRLQEGVTDAAE